MIEIECDNCERIFEVDDEYAGGKVKCPFCGDVNRVPSQPAASGGVAEIEPRFGEPIAEPAPAGGGDADESLPPDEGPEQHICDIRPAMFRAHPFRAILIFLLFVAGIVLAVMAGRGGQAAWIVWVALLPSALALLWAMKWYFSAHWWVKLSVSNKRTVRHEGIIARKTSEVLHDHVRNVEIRQNFIQRIFRVGFIGISSAGQDDIEIQVADIPEPYKVKELIDRYREM